MNQNRMFRKVAVVLSLIIAATIVISPSVSHSAPGAPDADPVIIDVEISLWQNVALTSRTPYNKIIQRFADAVFEASEGENKIGKVTIYQNGQCANKADIVWVQNCHPSGAVSGRAVNGQNINFCDIFTGSMNYITDPVGDQGGGYTLGHEWGHYYYSMYDEYVGIPSYDIIFYFPHSTDDAIPDALMNDQWDAIGGHYEWINFSTANSYQPSDETAQKRAYGASCWETLARAVSADPRVGQQATLPVRIHHPELAAVAPAAGNDPAIDLPDTAARSDLDIVWGSCEIAYQLVIDKSGSMDHPSKLPNVKTAAKMLVDLAPVGYSTIGVIAYNETVTVVQPLTAITSAAVKTTIKSQIDAITPGGYTAIGDAAKKGLDDLLATVSSDKNRVVYLLSDGRSNRGINPLSVIPNYQAANIPMYTFAYGADADVTLMQSLATGTGGNYYFSPTNLVDITNAFQDANLQSSPTVGISSGVVETVNILSPTAADYDYVSFTVDSTLSHFDIVTVFTGAADDMEFRVENPSGYETYPLVCSEGEKPPETEEVKERLCYKGIDISGDYGLWKLIYFNNTEGETKFSFHVTGYPDPNEPDPAKRFTYTASVTAFPFSAPSVTAFPDDFIKLPQPVKVLAVLAKEIPIMGATAIATILYPDGSMEPLELRDNGEPPDDVQDDGQYTGVFYPEEIGAYSISVEFSASVGSAYLTKLSHAPSHPKDGPPLPLPDLIPVADNFDRNGTVQVNILDYDKIYLPFVQR